MLAPGLLTLAAIGLQVIDNKTIEAPYVVLKSGATRQPARATRRHAANRR
jgi:hypothetical protein